MAVTIGEIPNDATTPIDGNELMELEQDGGSVKALVADIRNDGVREVSGDYIITGRADSRIVQVTTGATDRECFLPAGSGLEAGDEFEYMKGDSGVGTATLKAQGSDTIDGIAGATGVTLYSRRNKIRVRWTGSEFTMIALQSSGSNANGSFKLFADKRLMCQQSTATTGPPTAEVWPLAFASTPAASAIVVNASSPRFITLDALSATGYTPRAYRSTDGATTVDNFHIIAFGVFA